MLVLLSRTLCALPLEAAMGLARAMGWVWYYLLPVRRRTAQHNVARALGGALSPAEQRRVVRRCFTNLCYYVVEGLRMPALTPRRSRRLVGRHEMERLDRLLLRGRGIIAVTAHIGNFDLLGCSQTVRGYPVHAIVKDIRWRAGQLLWERVRAATGLGRVAPRRSWQTIKDLLGRNQIVAFLVDQHLPPHRAIVCEFFGQLAATTPAPVRMAFETGAPIVPIFMVREGLAGTHRVLVEPEMVLETPHADKEDNVRHNTERLNRVVERYIRTYPDQWLWQHKRWKVQDAPQGWHIPVQLRHLHPSTQATP